MLQTSLNQEQSAISSQQSAKPESLREQMNAFVAHLIQQGLNYDEAVQEFEKLFIEEELAVCRGNQCRAAREMRMHRNTLTRKINMLNIDVRRICERVNGRKSPEHARRKDAFTRRSA